MAFLPTGEFETVYSDSITADPAVEVVDVKRFSEVEFEEGYWVARRPSGREICRHKLRDECLKAEANLAAKYIKLKRKGIM